MKRKIASKFIIGIDEAGRGPLAGPVAVGVFAVRFDEARDIFKMFKAARDSKKMTPAGREEVFLAIKQAKKTSLVHFAVSFSSAKMIDEKGIVPAIRSALDRSLKKIERRVDLRTEGRPLQALDVCKVLLDGSLVAPARYKNQKTIIGGDDTEKVISLASICAKVLRDHKMARIAKKYPHYGFEIHKGYGTRAHYTAIKRLGPSPEHRKSFLAKIRS